MFPFARCHFGFDHHGQMGIRLLLSHLATSSVSSEALKSRQGLNPFMVAKCFEEFKVPGLLGRWWIPFTQSLPLLGWIFGLNFLDSLHTAF